MGSWGDPPPRLFWAQCRKLAALKSCNNAKVASCPNQNTLFKSDVNKSCIVMLFVEQNPSWGDTCSLLQCRQQRQTHREKRSCFLSSGTCGALILLHLLCCTCVRNMFLTQGQLHKCLSHDHTLCAYVPNRLREYGGSQ